MAMGRIAADIMEFAMAEQTRLRVGQDGRMVIPAAHRKAEGEGVNPAADLGQRGADHHSAVAYVGRSAGLGAI